jgi:hypothetical protein
MILFLLTSPEKVEYLPSKGSGFSVPSGNKCIHQINYISLIDSRMSSEEI